MPTLRRADRATTISRRPVPLGGDEQNGAGERNAENQAARVAPWKGEMTANQFVRCAAIVGCRTLVNELRPENVPPMDDVANEAERMAASLIASDEMAHRHALLLGVYRWATTARPDTN